MLVLVQVMVVLVAQVRGRAQGGPAVGALRGEETVVELLAQQVLFWRREKGEVEKRKRGGKMTLTVRTSVRLSTLDLFCLRIAE